MDIRIGFTGTQKGMTKPQLEFIDGMLHSIKTMGKYGIILHHGDCIGADKQIHNIVIRKKYGTVEIHPPVNASKRAFCQNYVKMHPEKGYLKRNKDIVNCSELMLATPCSFKEEIRSGTWSTIRYAKKIMKSLRVIWPDGTFDDFY